MKGATTTITTTTTMAGLRDDEELRKRSSSSKNDTGLKLVLDKTQCLQLHRNWQNWPGISLVSKISLLEYQLYRIKGLSSMFHPLLLHSMDLGYHGANLNSYFRLSFRTFFYHTFILFFNSCSFFTNCHWWKLFGMC